MEAIAILSKLKAAVPGGILEKSRFGRSDLLSVWVEAKALPEIAAFLRGTPGIDLDCLENLSAIQMDSAIVLTYFLRSSRSELAERALILRASVEPGGPSREADVPTVLPSWAMAAPFEAEIQELFGVRFIGEDGRPAHAQGIRLPRGWNGFPLRKSYVFPSQFLGISHSRRERVGLPEGSA